MNDALIFEKLTQALTANQDWPLKMAGDTFRIVTSFWPVSLTLKQAGRVIGTINNVQAGDYVKGIPFDEVVVNSAIAQSVTVLIASGGSGSDRIAGSVDVVDGGKSRTLAGGAYSTSVDVPAVAAENPYAMVVNPVGSGKNIFVESFNVGSTTAQNAAAKFATGTVGAVASNCISKLAGGAVGAGEIFSGTSAVAPAGTGGNMVNLKLAVSGMSIINFREPVCVTPGNVFYVVGGTVNTDLSASFETFEESI